MSSFKSQQCRLMIHERTFHFVSYEAVPANVSRNEPAQPSRWYLMAAGRRFASLECDPQQSLPDAELSLTEWAIANAIAVPVVAVVPVPAVRTARSSLAQGVSCRRDGGPIE